eukprot:gene3460-3935_t
MITTNNIFIYLALVATLLAIAMAQDVKMPIYCACENQMKYHDFSHIRPFDFNQDYSYDWTQKHPKVRVSIEGSSNPLMVGMTHPFRPLLDNTRYFELTGQQDIKTLLHASCGETPSKITFRFQKPIQNFLLGIYGVRPETEFHMQANDTNMSPVYMNNWETVDQGILTMAANPLSFGDPIHDSPSLHLDNSKTSAYSYALLKPTIDVRTIELSLSAKCKTCSSVSLYYSLIAIGDCIDDPHTPTPTQSPTQSPTASPTLPSLPRSVSGVTWIDTNNNGMKDQDEHASSLPIRVILSSVPSAQKPITARRSLYASRDGAYIFNDIPAGSYCIKMEDESSTLIPTVKEQCFEIKDENVVKNSALVNNPSPMPKLKVSGGTWVDINHDGIRDISEERDMEASPEVKVDLIRVMAEVGESPVYKRTTTDVDGYYEFTNIIAGHYCLKMTPVDKRFVPSTPGGDNSIGDDGTSCFVLTDKDLKTLNGGFLHIDTLPEARFSVMGSTWDDLNANGVHDASDDADHARNPILVILGSNTNPNTAIKITYTHMNGNYRFINVVPGDYCITMIDTTETTMPVKISADSSIDANGMVCIKVVDKDVVQGINGGFTAKPIAASTFTVSGDVWPDHNMDGVHQVTEVDPIYPSKDRVRVILTRAGVPMGDEEIFTRSLYAQMSDTFKIGDIEPGKYVLTMVDDSGNIVPTKAGHDSMIGENGVYTFEVLSQDAHVVAGFKKDPVQHSRAAVSGMVWADDNKDGIQQSSENKPIQVVVFLSKENGSPTTDDGPFIAIRTADMDLANIKGGFAPADPSTQPLYKVSGSTWEDLNKNGKRDESDDATTTRRPIIVMLDHVKLPEDLTTYPQMITNTDLNGRYKFSNVPKGLYCVMMMDATELTEPVDIGRDSVIDQTGKKCFQVSDKDVTKMDGGFVLKSKRVSGSIWPDFNGDGIKEPNEYLDLAPSPRIRVVLTWTEANGHVMSKSVYSDAKDDFKFKGLESGKYKLQMFDDSKLQVFTKPGHDSMVDSNGVYMFEIAHKNVENILAGITRNPIEVPSYSASGLVWKDINEDGLIDDNEPKFQDMTVELTKTADGPTFKQLTTGADGRFKFTYLPAGSYCIRMMDKSDKFAASEPGGDNTINPEGVVCFVINQHDFVNLNGGFKTRKTDEPDVYDITGDVWLDSNSNGLRDDPVPLTHNPTVITITDQANEFSRTTYTDHLGNYKLANIPAGAYCIMMQDATEMTIPTTKSPSSVIDAQGKVCLDVNKDISMLNAGFKPKN